ncbi:MAG: hypothetical protein JWR26_946 [Pedosphaera sp.]|nr:hypothetical protein [Pedosphaera sp.]
MSAADSLANLLRREETNQKYVDMLAAHKAVSPAGESPVVGSELLT